MIRLTRTALLSILLITLFPSYTLAVEGSLHLAIFPYVVHARTTKHHIKLTQYLTKELNMPVDITTVRNIREYLRHVRSGYYDIILTPPHIGRFAELSAGYVPLAITKKYIQGLYAVRKNAPYKTLSDLKYKTIAMSSPNAIIHQIAVQDFKEVGIRMGRDIRYRKVRDHNHAVIALAKKQVDIALTGVNVWKKLPERYKDKLRILQKGSKVPGFLFLANGKYSKSLRKKLKRALLRFDKSEKGQKYIFKGYKNVTAKMLKNLDKYTSALH